MILIICPSNPTPLPPTHIPCLQCIQRKRIKAENRHAHIYTRKEVGLIGQRSWWRGSPLLWNQAGMR